LLDVYCPKTNTTFVTQHFPLAKYIHRCLWSETGLVASVAGRKRNKQAPKGKKGKKKKQSKKEKKREIEDEKMKSKRQKRKRQRVNRYQYVHTQICRKKVNTATLKQEEEKK
jgi:hypothetical protein